MSKKLIVVYGCMYSGKSSFLLRSIQEKRSQRKNVLLCKPSLDTRYAIDEVVTHNGESLPCSVFADPADLFTFVENSERLDPFDVVAMDEVQFFSRNILAVVDQFLAMGKTVLCAGLDTDWQGQPFGSVPELIDKACEKVHIQSLCGTCKRPASWNQRLINETADILLGSHGIYEPRCDDHFQPRQSQSVSSSLFGANA